MVGFMVRHRLIISRQAAAAAAATQHGCDNWNKYEIQYDK